jgi:hypothetical protein
MGIATALVQSWEDGTGEPNSEQRQILSNVLRFDSAIQTPKLAKVWAATILIGNNPRTRNPKTHIAGTVASMTEGDPGVASEKSSYNALG